MAGSDQQPAYAEGTIIQSHDGSKAVIIGGYRRAITEADLMDAAAGSRATRLNVTELDEVSFQAVPEFAAPTTAPDFFWDTGLSGVRQGEKGHLASFKGRLHRDTGQLVMESRALCVTKLGGFHVRFTMLLVDDRDFPVPSSIPTPSLRIGVDGVWVGNNDRTLPWGMNISVADASRVANVHPAWGWDPDSLMTVVAKWQASGQALGTWLDNIKKVGQIFKGQSGGTS